MNSYDDNDALEFFFKKSTCPCLVDTFTSFSFLLGWMVSVP
jgi:hypothetical protein